MPVQYNNRLRGKIVMFFCQLAAPTVCWLLLVRALISVQALVFDLVQLTCQKVLQKCNSGVFCNTHRYVVQLNCGSSFAVGCHL